MGCLQIQESSSSKPIYALRRKRTQKVQDHLEKGKKLVWNDVHVHVQQFGPRVVNTNVACISIKFTVVVFFLQENAERELKKSFRCQKAFFKDLNPISVANFTNSIAAKNQFIMNLEKMSIFYNKN